MLSQRVKGFARRQTKSIILQPFDAWGICHAWRRYLRDWNGARWYFQFVCTWSPLPFEVASAYNGPIWSSGWRVQLLWDQTKRFSHGTKVLLGRGNDNFQTPATPTPQMAMQCVIGRLKNYYCPMVLWQIACLVVVSQVEEFNSTWVVWAHPCQCRKCGSIRNIAFLQLALLSCLFIKFSPYVLKHSL